MKTLKRWFQAVLIAAMLALPATTQTGCHKTLAPEGVYAQQGGGGVVAYDTDLSIKTAKDIIENFLTWEKANRPLLALKYPEVIKYASDLRAKAPGMLQSAVRLRDAYAANPTGEAKTAFEQAMAVIDQVVTEAQSYLAKSVKGK